MHVKMAFTYLGRSHRFAGVYFTIKRASYRLVSTPLLSMKAISYTDASHNPERTTFENVWMGGNTVQRTLCLMRCLTVYAQASTPLSLLRKACGNIGMKTDPS